MPNPTTAYLVCIQTDNGILLRRRIALTWSDAIAYVYAFAEETRTTVVENNDNFSGKIIDEEPCCPDYTYTIANIAVV